MKQHLPQKYHAEVERLNESAARNLEESLEETLTLHRTVSEYRSMLVFVNALNRMMAAELDSDKKVT